MRLVVGLIVAFALMGLLGAAASAGKKGDGDKKVGGDKTPRSDREKMLGTWAVVSMEVAGKKLPEDMIKDKTMVITAEKMVAKKVGNKDEVFIFTLNPQKTPRTIDIKEIDIKEKDKTMHGIYVFDGEDTLKICVELDSKDRPTDFTSKEGSKNVLVIFRREKK